MKKTVFLFAIVFAVYLSSSPLSANPEENLLNNRLVPTQPASASQESPEIRNSRKNLHYANAELMQTADECIRELGPETVISWARKRLYGSDETEDGRKNLLRIIDRAMQYQKEHGGSQDQPQATAQSKGNAQAQIEWDTQQRVEVFCREGGDVQGLIEAAAAERDSSASPQSKKYWNIVIKEAKLHLKGATDI